MTKAETMLKYVSKHNDFYKNRIKEYGITNPLDITQWPILTRKELQENRYNMFSDGYKSKYFNRQLRRQSSSGTTGMPVNVYWDYKDWYASNICLWRKRQKWYGIKPSDKYCVFTLNAFGVTPNKEKLYYVNEPSNIISFNVSLIRDESGYNRMAELINGFEPDWLYIQPFVLNQLICAYKDLNLQPVESIRYIESVGEILTSDLRRRAEKLFNVKVTNMYGSEEMNGIAIENPDGEMQILNNNVFLEVKNENGICSQGEGEAIVTNLNNFAMPLIRYEQGDGIYTKGTIIELTRGRQFYVPSINSKINTLTLSSIISEINNQFFDCILNYNFEFIAESNTILCSVRIEKEFYAWRTTIEQKIKAEIIRIFEDFSLNIAFTDFQTIFTSKKQC